MIDFMAAATLTRLALSRQLPDSRRDEDEFYRNFGSRRALPWPLALFRRPVARRHDDDRPDRNPAWPLSFRRPAPTRITGTI